MRRLIGTRLDYRPARTTADRGPGPRARGGRGVRAPQCQPHGSPRAPAPRGGGADVPRRLRADAQHGRELRARAALLDRRGPHVDTRGRRPRQRPDLADAAGVDPHPGRLRPGADPVPPPRRAGHRAAGADVLRGGGRARRARGGRGDGLVPRPARPVGPAVRLAAVRLLVRGVDGGVVGLQPAGLRADGPARLGVDPAGERGLRGGQARAARGRRADVAVRRGVHVVDAARARAAGAGEPAAVPAAGAAARGLDGRPVRARPAGADALPRRRLRRAPGRADVLDVPARARRGSCWARRRAGSTCRRRPPSRR